MEVGVEACTWWAEVRDTGGGGDSGTVLYDMLACGGRDLGKGGTRKTIFSHLLLRINSTTAGMSQRESVSGRVSEYLGTVPHPFVFFPEKFNIFLLVG